MLGHMGCILACKTQIPPIGDQPTQNYGQISKKLVFMVFLKIEQQMPNWQKIAHKCPFSLTSYLYHHPSSPMDPDIPPPLHIIGK